MSSVIRFGAVFHVFVPFFHKLNVFSTIVIVTLASVSYGGNLCSAFMLSYTFFAHIFASLLLYSLILAQPPSSPSWTLAVITTWSAHPLPCYLPSLDIAGVEDLSCSCPWWPPTPTSSPSLQQFFFFCTVIMLAISPSNVFFHILSVTLL